jgi:nicotinate-nucleotide adenylyltransferase
VKVGLFGGTFDPIHNAHLFVAEGARVALGLDRVAFLPSKGGRHRDSAPSAPATDRVAMIRLAIAANPAFALDESDLGAAATGYTADLLPLLRRRYPDARLTFIVGGDSLLDTPWQRFNEVLDGLDAFAVAPRADRPTDGLRSLVAGLRADRAAKILLMNLPSLAESATLVRAQLARGGSVRYIVPEPVWRYITERGLYQHAG